MNGVIKMCLLYSPHIKDKARVMLRNGTVTAFALFHTETAEVVDLKYNLGEAQTFLMNNNVKDDEAYASTVVNLQEVIL